ncbi:hypothetical protein B0H10DRAFT_495260 [Mycena sp. CBHHK59/15]|nr:hypothetical protein B0H10DRAFT_495260 [Mycena sp. CBHHK59/15]
MTVPPGPSRWAISFLTHTRPNTSCPHATRSARPHRSMALPPNSTMSTLPHELLGEIFAQCAAQSPDAPLVLGAVSHLFRHITHTTPAVWCNLDLDGARKAGHWFEMSKACLVNVHIHIAQVGNTEHGPTPAALESVRQHADRVKALHLDTETQAQARTALAAIYADPLALPGRTALRTLRIVTSAIAPAPGSPLASAFPAIPSIVELAVTNITLGALPGLGLDRLQRLSIVQPLRSTPLVAADLLELAHAAPSLRHLHVDTRIADASPLSPIDTRFLPHLVHLHLRANNMLAVLDHVIPPSLHTLHLSDLDGRRPHASGETGAALNRLLVRMELGRGEVKSNELRVFELEGVAVERGAPIWQRCVQRMRVLERFSVDLPAADCPVRAEFVAVNGRPEDSRPIEAGFAFGFGAAEKGEVEMDDLLKNEFTASEEESESESD